MRQLLLFLFLGCLAFASRANASQLRPDCSHGILRAVAHIEKNEVRPAYQVGNIVRRMAAQSEPYAVQTPDSTTLIFYYDYMKSSREGLVYDVKTTYAPANGLGALVGELTDFAPAWTFSKKIHKVIIAPSFHDFKPSDTFTWFYAMSNVDTIQGLKYINMSNVDDMCHMFRECASLVALDVSQLDVSHVTEMLSVFNGDTKLKYLVGLNRWDVCHATYMRSMFQGCSSIAAFDSIYDWDVHSVTNMNSMLRTAPC